MLALPAPEELSTLDVGVKLETDDEAVGVVVIAVVEVEPEPTRDVVVVCVVDIEEDATAPLLETLVGELTAVEVVTGSSV